jgi:hypothetical protein
MLLHQNFPREEQLLVWEWQVVEVDIEQVHKEAIHMQHPLGDNIPHKTEDFDYYSGEPEGHRTLFSDHNSHNLRLVYDRQ